MMQIHDELFKVADKIHSLGLWEAIAPYNWAVKPRGVAFPYFFTTLCSKKKEDNLVSIMLLEGWQTFHDFVSVRLDSNFGFVSVLAELPHYEIIFERVGDYQNAVRFDTGYAPRELTAKERKLLARILWECYGVIIRIESEPGLAMKYAKSKSVFARVEGPDGKWCDAPLEIPQPRPHFERIAIEKKALKVAKDLPFDKDFKLAIDLHMTSWATKEPRPKFIYELVVKDLATGKRVIEKRAVLSPDGGLRMLWEDMPEEVLREIITLGRVPGEVQVANQRMFRFLRPLGIELPFKLSIHEDLKI